MKILDPGLTPLTNAEVLHHVTHLETQYTLSDRHPSLPQNLKSVLRDIRTILEHPSQPTSIAQDPADANAKPNLLLSDPRVFLVLTRKLRGGRFKLLQSEVLQIFNHVPRDREKLGMLLEDAEQRFSEETLDEIVAVVEDVLLYGRGLDDVAMPDGRNGAREKGDGGGEEAKGEDVEMER